MIELSKEQHPLGKAKKYKREKGYQPIKGNLDTSNPPRSGSGVGQVDEDKIRWLEANTFICPHGLGRISPKQCEANRKRPRLKEIGQWTNPNIFPMPGVCEDCTEWKVLCEEVYKRKEKIMAESKKIVICAECGRRKTHKARGLCAACYERLKKRGQLPPIQRKQGPAVSKYRIWVDFSVSPETFEKLEQKAAEELRSLETQIVWEIKKSLGITCRTDGKAMDKQQKKEMSPNTDFKGSEKYGRIMPYSD